MKKSLVSPQQYVKQIGEIAQLTEETGEKTSPFFDKLDQVLQDENLDTLSKADFQEIASKFEDAVEVYQDAAAKLQNMKAPARIFGMHKTLAQIYQDYAAATEEMSDALDVDKQAVDVNAFRDSEEKQNDLIVKFGAQIRRVMMASM